jgi:hypothetical protein
MTATAPDPLTRQQLINLLSQHKQGVPRVALKSVTAGLGEAASI